ncbi:MAG TPA: DUF4160 domain-containing protein [Puia sp.]|jgi:hypothetical protein|nr:DUF4160 domain-containing protein [Puia sp.]
MPTLLTIQGIRFFFYSRENDEPPHVHFVKGKAFGKAWLSPVKVAYWPGFKTSEKRLILQTILANVVLFNQKWYEHFD